MPLGTKPTTAKANAARDFGTLAHAWKETGQIVGCYCSGRSICNECTLRKKLTHSEVDREDWWCPGDGEHEVTFALDVTVLDVHKGGLAIWVGPRDKSDEWKLAFDPTIHVVGTIDWIHWGSDTTVAWVDDLKTGHWPVDPRVSKQLRSYLLVPWVKAGCPSDWEGVCSVTTWEKYPLHGQPKRRAARFSGLDMMEHLEELRWTLSHPDEVNVTEDNEEDGTISNCTFCPNRESHPASAWMSGYRYSRFPMCWEGMQQRLM